MADDELWHVRISEHEIKTLTLEQIDDLFRLDVIDADTQLWQDGMDEWLPLRVVAGLDEEEEHVNVSVPPSMPPQKLGSTMSSWPPPAVAAPAAAVSSWPPMVSPSRPPAAPSSRPLPPSSLPAPPSARGAAFAPTVASWPPSVSGSIRPSAPASAAPGLFSPSYAPPASVRPQLVAEPVRYARPVNPMPIVLAVVVGLVITLYRNDLLHAAAHTIGQEGAYLKLEEALGGPSFGTPRAVESMAKAADALPDLTVPTPASTSKSEPSTTDDDSSSKTASSKSTTPARPEPKKVAPPPVQPAPRAAPASAPPRTEEEAPNSVFKQRKGAKKAKGAEFDPLNPSL